MFVKELQIADYVYCTYWTQKYIEQIAEIKSIYDDE